MRLRNGIPTALGILLLAAMCVGCAEQAAKPSQPSADPAASNVGIPAVAPSSNPTVPLVEDVPAASKPDSVGYIAAFDFKTYQASVRKRSLGSTLDPVAAPTVSADVAASLLARPEVRQAIDQQLGAIDWGYEPESAADPQPVKTTIFQACGALPFTRDPTKFRIFGVAWQRTWLLIGALPSLHGIGSGPAWIDVDTSPTLYTLGAHAAATSVVSVRAGDLAGGLDTSVAAAVPGWVVDRINRLPRSPRDETEFALPPEARTEMVRLIRSWVDPRVTRDMTRSLPKGYTAQPHSHQFSAALKQLSPAAVDSIFQRRASSSLDVDFKRNLAQAADSPLQWAQTTYNWVGDYHALLNKKTGRALKILGFSRFDEGDLVWRGSVLIIDLVVDSEVGLQPSGLHCEIDWKKMRVLRAIPYGPVSPF